MAYYDKRVIIKLGRWTVSDLDVHVVGIVRPDRLVFGGDTNPDSACGLTAVYEPHVNDDPMVVIIKQDNTIWEVWDMDGDCTDEIYLNTEEEYYKLGKQLILPGHENKIAQLVLTSYFSVTEEYDGLCSEYLKQLKDLMPQ